VAGLSLGVRRLFARDLELQNRTPLYLLEYSASADPFNRTQSL